MKLTAIYNGKKVFIVVYRFDLDFAFVSYRVDGLKKMPVRIEDLENIKPE